MKRILAALVMVLVCIGLAYMPGAAWAQLGSLKTVVVPQPPDLSAFVKNKAAAIQLGKALFWDMQVGSDGIQACASCHFQAGADRRNKNTMNPGQLAGDSIFYKGVPNTNTGKADFPFHKLINPDDPNSGLVRPDCNDVVGSQGVVKMQFLDIQPGNAVDLGTPVADPIFNVGGINVRQVTGRNTPPTVNAVYNFSNFWDGRGNNVFNGCNPFGAADMNARIMVNTAGSLTPTAIRIRNASLASQSVGPPMSDVEMSWAGRTFPKLGKKMLGLLPLAKQIVHPQDSVLGSLANSTLASRLPGLKVNYASLIQQAFVNKYWNNTTQIVTYDAAGVPTISPNPGTPLTTDQYTQMEANFSFFWGLAILCYESTLVANDSRFDRFMDGTGTLTAQEQAGMGTFTGAGHCDVCHAGPEFTAHAVRQVLGDPGNGLPPNPKKNPFNAIEFMGMLNGSAFYDFGMYNIGERPTTDDIGRGGNTPFANPSVPGTNFPLSFSRSALLKVAGLLPPSVATYTPDLPAGFLPTDTSPTAGRVDVDGACKVPHLRNIELTGPYFHNGGHLTLRQIASFYARGGDFRNQNIDNLSPDIQPIGKLRGSTVHENELVAFLLSLTDDRVRFEAAPFDHPALLVPQGARANGADIMLLVPEVGAGGRVAEGLPPLQSFLNVNQFSE